MKKEKKKWSRRKKLLVFGGVPLALLLIATLAFFIYVMDYYHADKEAIESFMPDFEVEVVEDDDMIAFVPESAETGFIFYPGGKVVTRAYVPLMRACAAKGILCVLIEMPFRLAVFDIDAAEGVAAQFPSVSHWYIGGHSLGGSMAASYAADNASDFDGVILLAAYSTENLANKGLSVLSVYGSEDRVLNMKKYEKNKKNLPADYVEHVIAGGCHAYFGMYGKQAGDGHPTITAEEQIMICADLIFAFVER